MRRIAHTALAGAGAAAMAAVVLLVGPAAMAAGGGVPFTDPNAHGYIAFCDLAGDNITSGSVTATPFVWKAVSSTSVTPAFSGPGQNVALTVYQPRPGVDPGEWNGDQLTAASFFRKTSPPTAVATYKDISLATIVREFPPTWDGLYQLRLESAKLGYGDDSATYPATVIQVTGSRWHVVQGGTLPCGTARATSQETFAGIPVSKAHPASSVAHADQATDASRVISEPLNNESRSTPRQSATATVVVGAATGCLLAILTGGVLWRRRSTRSSISSERTV